MTKKDTARLANIYKALTGVVSEYGDDAFDRFYKGGTAALFSDFEAVLVGAGVSVSNPEYCVRPYNDKTTGRVMWGVASNPTGDPEWALTGFDSSTEAVEVLRDKQIFGDCAVENPRVIDMPAA